MSSSINPNNINGTYPVAGQDNDSQGFRDNFTNIKNNLTYAKNELEDLQNKSLLISALTGGTTPTNNLNGTLITGPQIKNATEAKSQLIALSGAINLDYSAGLLHYTTIDATSGSVNLTFLNWPVASLGYAKVRLYVTVVNSTYTLTLPTMVSVGTADIEGSTGQLITFPSPGNYMFEFSSIDGGTTIIIQDLLRNYETQVGNAVTFISTTISGTLTTGGAKIDAGYQYLAATTGFTLQTYSNVARVIFDPAGTIASGRLTLPTANVDALTVTVSSTQTITAFQVLPNTGTTLVPSANITLAAGTSATYFYHLSETRWYKIG